MSHTHTHTHTHTRTYAAIAVFLLQCPIAGSCRRGTDRGIKEDNRQDSKYKNNQRKLTVKIKGLFPDLFGTQTKLWWWWRWCFWRFDSANPINLGKPLSRSKSDCESKWLCKERTRERNAVQFAYKSLFTSPCWERLQLLGEGKQLQLARSACLPSHVCICVCPPVS